MPTPVNMIVSASSGHYRELTDDDTLNVSGMLGKTLSASKVFAYTSPASADAVSVHSGVAASFAALAFPTIVQPPIPRNLVVTLASGWDGGDVTVVGTNQFDEAVSEVFLAGSAVTRTGVKVFKTVTSITKSLVGASGALGSVGVGSKLGISGVLADALSAVLFIDNGASAATLDATYHAFTPSTVPDGALSYALIANILR